MPRKPRPAADPAPPVKPQDPRDRLRRLLDGLPMREAMFLALARLNEDAPTGACTWGRRMLPGLTPDAVDRARDKQEADAASESYTRDYKAALDLALAAGWSEPPAYHAPIQTAYDDLAKWARGVLAGQAAGGGEADAPAVEAPAPGVAGADLGGAEGAQIAPAPPTPKVCPCGLVHSDDFATVTAKGRTFGLTPREQAAFAILHDAYLNGNPDVPLGTAFSKAQSEAGRQRGRELFKTSGLWKAGVVTTGTEGRRGRIRLTP